MSKHPTINHVFLNNEDKEIKQDRGYAKRAVKKYNDTYEHLYTADEKAEGAALLAQAQSAFIRSRCWLNYRKKTMVVKVESPTSADRVTAAVSAFEQAIAVYNPDLRHDGGHYLFHIFPRK